MVQLVVVRSGDRITHRGMAPEKAVAAGVTAARLFTEVSPPERFTFMTPALRPATVEALASFRRRRTNLLLKRAALSAVIVLLLLLLVVALLDRATFMPDALRQGLSYFGYFAAVIAAWRMALRFVKEAKAEEGA